MIDLEQLLLECKALRQQIEQLDTSNEDQRAALLARADEIKRGLLGPNTIPEDAPE